METKKKGTVFEIERFAINDGPGIRTLVFLKGCPLACTWCSNPESQVGGPQIMWWKTRCLGCLRCVEVCPHAAIAAGPGGIVIDKERCTYCGLCAQGCNAEALTMVGKVMSVEDVMREISKDEGFYENSGGGVTFSGGEAFAQYPFLLELCKTAKKRRYHTCIETTGYTDWEKLKATAEYIDIFLYDLKCMDDEVHKKVTGVSNTLILENYIRLKKTNANIIVRVPVIPGINDDDENFRKMATFLAKHSPGCRIDLLPYHRLGISKYERLRMGYELPDLEPPPEKRMDEIKAFLEKEGFAVGIGGK
ncbi:MAG: glycyl-radical enzyme activating protein [Christensenella sp.]|uniref:glycyl-radical enzyme activating protein n=1 Tax=Christensenella sp. TaxID=1935934 RepID=UPI002B212939|nr:glycyl-radical enzyme activating protein [Christensenella sp.]MEA5001939.1 glycyl-radical enzyme activating protein [Christensenella sp.]